MALAPTSASSRSNVGRTSGRGMGGSSGNLSSTRLSSAQSELKTLETTRQRLLQLTWTLSALKRDMELSDPLPSWPNIQTSFALLTHHLSQLASLLATTDDDDDDDDANVLQVGHAHPLPTFPVNQEGLLGQLLRKKLELGVERWVVSGQETAKRSVGIDNPVDTRSEGHRGGHGSERGNGHEVDEEMWNWAARRVRELGRRVPWNTDYTLAERQMGIDKVKTGLKRKLDSSGPSGGDNDDADARDSEGDDDDDEDDSDEEDAGAAVVKNSTTLSDGQPQSGAPAVTAGPKMLSLEDVYRYMSTGPSIVSPGR